MIGPVVATEKHPGLQNHAVMMVQPLDEEGTETGSSFVAVDHTQSGAGDVVLVLTEGTGVRQILGDPKSPIRSLIVGVVDQVHLG